MATEYNVTSYITDECYENYYRQSTDWDKYYNSLAEKADREYEDSLWEEE